MKREQEPVDVTEPLLELVRGLDFAFDQKSDEHDAEDWLQRLPVFEAAR